MKHSKKFTAILAVSALAVCPTFLLAQDAPPPPDGAYAPPPPADDSGAPPPDAGGDSGASFQQFYDQLGSQGTWVQTDNYGYAFQPNVSDPNWAPYTDGHWANTEVGWTWVSDEPWGWATYHYGRWANIDGTGWVWIPGTQWAPAWVSWRYGGGYCGWAPLPPETFVGVDFGDPGVDLAFRFHFGSDCDENYGIGAGCYNFIAVGDFGNRDYRGRYLDRGRNFVVINNTRNITNINFDRRQGGFNGVRAGGPDLAEINRQSHTRVQTLRLAEAGQPGRAQINGDTLNVYAPRVNGATLHTARPERVGRTIANARLNRGESINNPLAVNSNLRPAAASAEQIQAAERARASAPKDARIAAEGMQPRTTLNRPLTSMESPAAARQARAETNRTANQDHAQAEKDARIQHAEANKTANQDHAQAEKDARVQHAEADKAANQQHAQEEKDARVQHAEADKAANQQHAQEEKDARVQHAEADKTANQQHAQEEKDVRVQHAEADKTANQQHAQEEQQARQERAAAAQHANRAPAPQERAPQQHERTAPAPQQRAAPAQGGGDKGDKKNNQ